MLGLVGIRALAVLAYAGVAAVVFGIPYAVMSLKLRNTQKAVLKGTYGVA